MVSQTVAVLIGVGVLLGLELLAVSQFGLFVFGKHRYSQRDDVMHEDDVEIAQRLQQRQRMDTVEDAMADSAQAAVREEQPAFSEAADRRQDEHSSTGSSGN